jgi:hypothetical protein
MLPAYPQALKISTRQRLAELTRTIYHRFLPMNQVFDFVALSVPATV